MPRIRNALPKALTRQRQRTRLYATAREASLANLEIARERHRPWRPWRSLEESWQIRHLVWQWSTHRGPKWSGRTLARYLGVRHRYVQKLISEFVSNPAKMRQEARESGFEMATFEQLREARERTREMAERGLLRPFRRSKRGELKIIWTSLRIPQQIPIWATAAYGLLVAI